MAEKRTIKVYTPMDDGTYSSGDAKNIEIKDNIALCTEDEAEYLCGVNGHAFSRNPKRFMVRGDDGAIIDTNTDVNHPVVPIVVGPPEVVDAQPAPATPTPAPAKPPAAEGKN